MSNIYAEIIFEPGSKSVMSFDSEDELKGFLQEHNNRALSGDNGGPSGHAAERIKRVIVYSSHPAEYGTPAVNSENLATLIDGMTRTDGTLDGQQVIAAVRDEMSPVYPVDQGRHESMFKQEGQEYDLSFLGGNHAA